MKLRKLTTGSALAAAVIIASCAHAQDASSLGKTLTPLGAEIKGNAEGSIPAWTGGDQQVGKGIRPGAHFDDPYASEKPLYVISAGNADQYKDKLSAGHLAMLKKYPGFRMNVYPTHRSAFFPKTHYDETIANATRAKLTPDGGLAGTTGGVPFPLPKSGVEAITNHVMRYTGNNLGRVVTRATVSPTEAIAYSKFEIELLNQYGNTDLTPATRANNVRLYYMYRTIAPARIAGTLALAHTYVNRQGNNEYQSVWIYSPGQRRVRLGPEFAYDNPQDDGMRTFDELDEFNGSTDRFDWKLLGKRETLVPYNTYRLMSKNVKYAELLKPNHLNPDHMRYELHRTWIVEATLAKGASHGYGKRVFYLDEDSWSVLAQDKYDARGELWRLSESMPSVVPEVGALVTTIGVHHDLRSGRYLADNLINEEKERMTPLARAPDYYTPQNLRSLGTR